MPAKNTWKTKSIWPEIKDTLSRGSTITVFDLETTGLSRRNDRIIEIAAIRYVLQEDFSLREQFVYHQYINPERPLPPEIIKLTGITDEQLAGQPTEKELFFEIQDVFDGEIVAGYNSDTFDIEYLKEYFGRMGNQFTPAGSLDCIKMARNLLNKGTDVEDFKLKTVGGYFGVEFQAHSGIDDARATARLLEIFLKEYAALEAQAATEAPLAGTLHPQIEKISFWDGFKGFSRIYITTDCGTIYYDLRSCLWGGKDIDINAIDMEWLEPEVYRAAGVNTQAEFSKFRDTISLTG